MAEKTDRRSVQWQRRACGIAMLLSVLLYIFIYVNVPVTLIPGGMHDDGFFMLRGMSIVAHNWMGPYNQYTLIKGAGYPLFLAAASIVHLPATLAHAILFCFAVWLLAVLTRRVFHSIWLSLTVFEVVLWNLGPESNRIVRDAIYHSQFLLCFALIPLTFLETRRNWRMALGALSGLMLGWMLITREEGSVTLLPLALIAGYFLLAAFLKGRQGFRSAAVVATVCVGFTLLPPLLVATRNYRRYRQFETVDTQGPFAAAISALESIDQSNERPFLAISREVRDKAYAVSPTFARLRPLMDDPGAPLILGWKNAGCQFLPATCGDYGVGWFMWGMRDAAAMSGAFADAHTSAVFFRSIRNEIQAACESGRIQCHHSPIPLMPHVIAGEVQAFPMSLSALTRRLLFLVPPTVESGPSIGTLGQMQDAVAFTNVFNFTPAPALAPAINDLVATRWARAMKTFSIDVYQVLMPVLLPAGLIAFAVCVVLAIQKRTCPLALVLTTAAWTAVVLRLLLLSLIDVTSFGTVSNLYISLAFPASCFAAVMAFPLLRQMLAAKRAAKAVAPMPVGFRGVGESERLKAGY